LTKENNKIVYSKVGNPQEWYMSDILRNVFGISEKVKKKDDKDKKSIEDKLKEYSNLVKEYSINPDLDKRNKIEALYIELIPSFPEGSPRRRVLDRLKELV
jgi:hypothetical protein